MKLILIGGVPASGKTTKGLELGQKHNCLSLELESKRWDFYKKDTLNNMFKYTNTKIKENETHREYYLRNTLYENLVDEETFRRWNIETAKYISKESMKVYKELKKIYETKDLLSLNKFIKNNSQIINYIPKEISIDILDTVVMSHVLITNMEIVKYSNENIICNTDIKECVNRFKKREKLSTDKYDDNIFNYINNCGKCIVDINKKDIRIKNDGYNFHYRIAALIKQDEKYLVQQIKGYDYYILPGGHALLGESSIQALDRELKEEIGNNIKIKDYKLFCDFENFYRKNLKIEHWVEKYFLVTTNKLPSNNWQVVEEDSGETKTLDFIWLTKEEIIKLDLKPVKIKQLIVDDKINEFNFLIGEL